jgi:hypothetical protein
VIEEETEEIEVVVGEKEKNESWRRERRYLYWWITKLEERDAST